MKSFIILILVNLSFFAIAQDEIPNKNEKAAEKKEITEADIAWEKINELLVKRQEAKDEEYKKVSETLLAKLQDYVKREDIGSKHKNFGVSMIANLMAELKLFTEFLEFSEKYIAEPDILEPIKTLLKESRIKVLFELENYDDLTSETEKHLAELTKIENLAGDQKLTKAFFILYKTKALIMLGKQKDNDIQALSELKILQKNEKDPETLYKLKSAERLLKHFMVIHPGAELENWSLKTVDKNEINLADNKGKFVLLFFWQSWISSCKTMINKYLKKMETDFADLKIFGISNETTDVQNEFMQENNITWNCLVDSESMIYRKYSISFMPYIILVDKQSKVVLAGSFDVMPKLQKYLETQKSSEKVKPEN